MRLRCSAAAGHIRRFAPDPAGQGYVPMPDYLVAFYDSGRTMGRIGRGLQVRLPAVLTSCFETSKHIYGDGISQGPQSSANHKLCRPSYSINTQSGVPGQCLL